MNRDILDKIYQSNRNINPGLLCIICHKILLHPQQSKCGHRFCKICLDNSKPLKNPLCAKCNVKVKDIRYDYAALREINELLVTCPNDCCVYQDNLGQISEHIVNCSQKEATEETFQDCEDMEGSTTINLSAEIMEIKRNIEILMGKNDQIHKLTNECYNLRTLVDDTAKRHEKCLKELSDELHDKYSHIDTSLIRSDSVSVPLSNENYIYMQKEIKELRESYESFDEYMRSLNKFNKKIKESISDLYSKIKALDDDTKTDFHQFYEDIEYLTNEFSIIKSTNEKKVVKFYNKLSRNTGKLSKLSTKLPELYGKINNLRQKMSDVIENHVEYEQFEIKELENQMSDMDKEIDTLKTTIIRFVNLYPNSVFVTVYFQEKVGMNMSLSEMEIFCHQFESDMITVRQQLSQAFGLNRGSLTKSKRHLMRRPAFTMSDRKKKTVSKIIDEV